MNYLLKLSFTMLLGLIMFSSYAQRGGGPSEFIEREKQAVIKKIEDLSEDQKILLSGIYDEFGVSLMEIFQNRDENTTRESMREKMLSLRKEKDELIADVLNEEQYVIYTGISSSQRRRGKDNEKEESNQSTEEN